jgi:hypothetical protein
VIRDARSELGPRWSLFSQVTRLAKQWIAPGAHVCATPRLPGFQFNPLSLTIGFTEAWHRMGFELRAVKAPLNQFASGSITFTVEALIVADVPLSVYVSEDAAQSETRRATVKPYDRVFCSYSHRDTRVVEHVEKAYRALGIEYLRDVRTLRSGEAWNPRLLAMIEDADIFQLFWSPSAAASKYVRQEWEHALEIPGKPSNFVRPVYWQEPMPEPPPQLSRIHFRYEPGLAE